MGFLPNRDNNTVLIYHIDDDKKYWKKLDMNNTRMLRSILKIILETIPHEITATATYLPYLKQSKYAELDMRNSAAETKLNW